MRPRSVVGSSIWHKPYRLVHLALVCERHRERSQHSQDVWVRAICHEVGGLGLSEIWMIGYDVAGLWPRKRKEGGYWTAYSYNENSID